MKWYPLAHLAAVTMSCFCPELQALQLLFPNSASGIARALPSFLSYICKFPDSRCRPLMSLPNNLNFFQRCRGGKHKLCTYGRGREWRNLVGLHPVIRKDHWLIGIHFSLARARKSPKNRHSILYSSSCQGKHLIGDIAMVIVKFRPRWPHTWRNALHSLSRKTVTSGRKGKCIAAAVDEQAVAKCGVIL